ncbi:MAG: ferredoxin [Alphaproteobacteria bacterium]|jgi:hypothetical protein|nr:ferredoxin [Alphaproteobacteria bacterium]
MSAEILELAGGKSPDAKLGGDRDGAAKITPRPALLAGYWNLTELRYDYPLVLVADDTGVSPVRSLTAVIDGVLREIAPRGAEGEAARKHVLGIEREIRGLLSADAGGTLSELWGRAKNTLLARAEGAAADVLKENLDRARSALAYDGEMVDCGAETADTLIEHIWKAVQADKIRRLRGKIEILALRLSDILKADAMQSAEARDAESLERSVGTSFRDSFDFEAMSRLLIEAPAGDPLPEERRRRIGDALSVLDSQKFFAPWDGGEDTETYTFLFDSCAAAAEAFQARVAEMVALVKAISIAELEVENGYRESKHDPLFSGFDENALSPEDIASFPSYLVRLSAGRCEPAEKAHLIELLSSDLPVKILARSDDLLEGLSGKRFSFGAGMSDLASLALGQNNAYVLQSTASHLYQLRDRIVDGLTCPGPALFSVFSGSAGSNPDLPPYLVAAAAMEARAFPAFTYDPAAGADWAARFEVTGNPQAEADWPTHRLSYADQDLQTIAQDFAFTFVDFVACDPRYAQCFEPVPADGSDAALVPVSEFIDPEAEQAAEAVPYVMLLEDGGLVRKAVVDGRLIRAARRCRERWRSLQELGGIDNSHARNLLASARQAWEDEKERELAVLKGRPVEEPEAPTAEPAPAEAEAPIEEAPEEVLEEPAGDDPYIETPRCTTCDECTEINNAMFAYDDNRQAYIANPDGGTYREMVEAAESCQVAIIHPGKPRNPNEPGLEELIQRAESFM